jgi:DNA repair protein RadC
MDEKALREGHRERVREKIDKNGFSSLSDYEAVEYILFQTQPYRDTKPTAKALVERFGGFANVIGANIEDLKEVKGVGETTAHFLCHLKDVFAAYKTQSERPRLSLSGITAVEYLRKIMEKEGLNECVYVLYMTEKQEVLAHEKVADGEKKCVELPTKEIIAGMLRHKAKCLIIAHNHTSINCSPSKSDVFTTKQFAEILGSMGVKLLDHIILSSGGNAYSFYHNRYFTAAP